MPKEAHFKYRKRAKEVHPSGSVIQAEKKGTSSVALQVPFWATWAVYVSVKLQETESCSSSLLISIVIYEQGVKSMILSDTLLQIRKWLNFIEHL